MPENLLAQTWAKDRGDVVKYTLANAPYIGLAGLVTGLQEAYFKFEVSEVDLAS